MVVLLSFGIIGFGLRHDFQFSAVGLDCGFVDITDLLSISHKLPAMDSLSKN